MRFVDPTNRGIARQHARGCILGLSATGKRGMPKFIAREIIALFLSSFAISITPVRNTAYGMPMREGGGKGMKICAKLATALWITVIIFAESWAHGADVAPGDGKWEFQVIPYFWMAGIDGDATVKGIDSKVDATFGDIWNNLEFGGQVYMEARKDRWGLFLNPTYLKLSSDAHVDRPIIGRINADLTVKEWLVEFGGFYRLAKRPLGSSEKGALSVDVLGGAGIGMSIWS